MMKRGMREMLALEPTKFHRQADFFACLDENLVRASRLIEYMESDGFEFRWGRGRAGDQIAVQLLLGAENRALVKEVEQANAPFLSGNHALYVTSVLAVREIIAKVAR